MGNLYDCCTQTLDFDDNDESEQSNLLHQTAKKLGIVKLSQFTKSEENKCYKIISEESALSKCTKYKQFDDKNQSNNKPYNYDNKLPTKQCNKFKQENEKFIARYGSYFSANSEISDISSLVTSESIGSAISISSKHSSLLSSVDSECDILDIDDIPFSPVLLQKSVSFQNDNEFDGKCESVTNCKAIKRIIKALKWYSFSNNNHEILLNKMMANQYQSHILNDYQHLLNHHLFQEYHDEINMNKEYQLIRQEINQQIDPCDIKRCIGFKRFKQEIYKKDLSQCNDNRFCLDFMDLIHCYLMHSQYLY